MKREQIIRRQLASLDMLGDAVNAMKSLSAHHLRTTRHGLTPAREYRSGVTALLASAGIVHVSGSAAAPAVLILAADLGLCDGYNLRLAEAAVDEVRRIGARKVYCVGRRPLPLLRRGGIDVAATYPAVTSVSGLTGLLLRLADDVLGDYLKGTFGTLHVVSAHFDGVGAFTPMATQVLPIAPEKTVRRPAATPYGSAIRLVRVAIREYLYSTLYELLLDALASEHGARLVSTQSAAEWLGARTGELHRQLWSVRREASTQEVLEVAAGARQRAHGIDPPLGATH